LPIASPLELPCSGYVPGTGWVDRSKMGLITGEFISVHKPEIMKGENYFLLLKIIL
jgi:hypothetical protein